MKNLAKIQVNTHCVWVKKKTEKLRLDLCQLFQKESSQTERIDSEATEGCFMANNFL